MITFNEEDFKGSRLRCLQITSQPPERVRSFLNALVSPYAEVMGGDTCWSPGGFLQPAETKLVDDNQFLDGERREELKKWWLAVQRGNMPNWDLISRCDIGGGAGLLLVEAKAHEDEFKCDKTGAKDENRDSIIRAIREANQELNGELPGFHISADAFYQLSNRFAFGWKLAKMGIPTVLVYLGFLDAEEMAPNKLLRTPEQWERLIKEKAADCIPPEAWSRRFVDGKFTALIRSARVDISAEVVQ